MYQGAVDWYPRAETTKASHFPPSLAGCHFCSRTSSILLLNKEYSFVNAVPQKQEAEEPFLLVIAPNFRIDFARNTLVFHFFILQNVTVNALPELVAGGFETKKSLSGSVTFPHNTKTTNLLYDSSYRTSLCL